MVYFKIHTMTMTMSSLPLKLVSSETDSSDLRLMTSGYG